MAMSQPRTGLVPRSDLDHGETKRLAAVVRIVTGGVR